MNQIKLNDFIIGNNTGFILIAGPCVLENDTAALDVAQYLQKMTSKLKIPFIFKASYDKANRTSINSYRGAGIERRSANTKAYQGKTGCAVTIQRPSL